jgi:hypothetical protein
VESRAAAGVSMMRRRVGAIVSRGIYTLTKSGRTGFGVSIAESQLRLDYICHNPLFNNERDTEGNRSPRRPEEFLSVMYAIECNSPSTHLVPDDQDDPTEPQGQQLRTSRPQPTLASTATASSIPRCYNIGKRVSGCSRRPRSRRAHRS